jgi:hypothetical protein
LLPMKEGRQKWKCNASKKNARSRKKKKRKFKDSVISKNVPLTDNPKLMLSDRNALSKRMSEQNVAKRKPTRSARSNLPKNSMLQERDNSMKEKKCFLNKQRWSVTLSWVLLPNKKKLNSTNVWLMKKRSHILSTTPVQLEARSS